MRTDLMNIEDVIDRCANEDASPSVAQGSMPTLEEVMNDGPDLDSPPCQECGAMTPEEAETMCICSGDKDDCHGCRLWPD